jgi:S1-C subfamily serine protease
MNTDRPGRRALRALLVVLIAAAPVARAADEAIQDAIVKIYTVVDNPDYYNPWRTHGPSGGTGSGCVIEGRKILSNAHVVGNQTFVQVRRYGEAKRYQARVLEVSHEADLALLTVDDEDFFEGVTPIGLGDLPEAQDEVLVYGFPLGGDTLSITKGVISRIEHQVYVHSSCNLLAGQIDAAINPGNSGGPVIMDGRIVGVVMQGMQQADNIGYMVPVNVVKHFFQDIADTTYDGWPSLGVVMQEMENPGLRRQRGMSDEQTGLLIIKVLPGSPATGILQEGDVFMAIEGHAVADDGTVEFRPKQRTSVSYFLQEKQLGETAKVTLLRDGVASDVDIRLTRPLWKDWLVPMEQYDRMPTYYIYGGVVFVPLAKNLLQAWGPNWYQNAPNQLTARLGINVPEVEGEQVVMVLKVLAADVNQGYHDVAYWVVEEVDGQRIRNVKQLIEAVEAGRLGEFVTFTSDADQVLTLDRKAADESAAEILRTYRIARDRSDDLVEGAAPVESPE